MNKAVKEMSFMRVRQMVTALTVAAGSLLATSCDSTIYDEGIDCENEVYVHLKYDYNIQRADMYAEHAGYAIIFALDENEKVVAQQTVQKNNAPLMENPVKFSGLQPGRYHFVAMAMQRPYQELGAQNGARFRATLPQVGSSIQELEVKLDREATPDALGFHAVNAPSQGLDTLWIGHSTGILDVTKPYADKSIYRDTISLVRDTKYLNLTLHQLEDRAGIFDEDFTVRITDANGWLGWNNELKADDKLLYTPHAQWTTALSQNGVPYMSQEEALQAPAHDPIVERAAHYEISFSRLMYYAAASQGRNAVLQIARRQDGSVVAEINLPYYLAFARNAYALQHYSPQEYLDREYQYYMDFFLEKGKWAYMSLHVNILPWVMRFQNETLGEE